MFFSTVSEASVLACEIVWTYGPVPVTASVPTDALISAAALDGNRAPSMLPVPLASPYRLKTCLSRTFIIRPGENQPGSHSRPLVVIGRKVEAATGTPKDVSMASPVAEREPARSVMVGNGTDASLLRPRRQNGRVSEELAAWRQAEGRPGAEWATPREVARIRVEVAYGDGTAMTFAADRPEKAEIDFDWALPVAPFPWEPPALQVARPPVLRVSVSFEAHPARPATSEIRTAPACEARLTDRELLDPVLGSPWMRALAGRDREAWAATGDLIAQAFEAGKFAAGPGRKP